LGGSDVDVIRDQQELDNKLATKITEKLLAAGSVITMPRGLKIRTDDSECKRVDVSSAQEADMIKAINLQPNIQYDLQMRATIYDEAQSTLGITPSYQGKPDSTAESGRAKEIQVQQSSGRLESKHVMKDAAYEELFHLMALFKLAYTDESRPYSAEGAGGDKEYGAFSRYDYIKKDADGKYYYEDQFLFSTDPAGSLSQNRQAMWDDAKQTLQYGGYGDPAKLSTLRLYWSHMVKLNYPGAKYALTQIEEMIKEEQAVMQQQMQIQQQQAVMQTQQQTQPQQPKVAEGEIEQMLAGI
jgi:hypothetical protein